MSVRLLLAPPSPPRPATLAALTRDGWLLFAARSVRAFAYGFLSVILALYLARLGLTPDAIGLVFTAALAGGAVATIVVSGTADRVGRRRVLALGAALMAAAGAVFALGGAPWLLVAAAVAGTISPSGAEVGPFLAVEQAILPQVTAPKRRTATFAWYNLFGWFAGALGALVAGVPSLLQAAGWAEVDSLRALVWAYAATGLVLTLLFLALSAAVELELPRPVPGQDRPDSTAGLSGEAVRVALAESQGEGQQRPRRILFGLHRSTGIVARLAALFAVDALAGGFVVQSLVAYWFHVRFGAEPALLGAIFFGTNLFTALSFLAAARIADRFGLLNTMVFTHLPSNVLLALVAVMPTLPLAVLTLLARHVLSQMDVPTRQAYTMALVAPEERAAAAGLTSVARNVGASLGPVLSGALLSGTAAAAAWPFLIAGGLKSAYDLALYATFRKVRVPAD